MKAYFIIALLLLSTLTIAENNTTALNSTGVSDALNDVSNQAKTWMEKIKAIIPYEIWFCLSIGLSIVYLFTRGANSGYQGIWKSGLYVAIIAVIIWFLLTR